MITEYQMDDNGVLYCTGANNTMPIQKSATDTVDSNCYAFITRLSNHEIVDRVHQILAHETAPDSMVMRTDSHGTKSKSSYKINFGWSFG